ncbi:MAG: hypothetical protein ACU836_10405 [Gammaproteobacteria bacterium]
MKILIALLLMALTYGGFLILWNLIKDLAEMTVEAWRCGDTEQ